MLIPESSLYTYIYPVILTTIALEALVIYYRSKYYPWRESFASLGVWIGQIIFNRLFAWIPSGLLMLAWQHRLMTIELDRPWKFLVLFIGVEFCYYWYHRSAHQIRWLWATHAVHHSSEHFNFSAAYRLGWTNWLSGNILFFMPLCWLGFSPIAVAGTLVFNLFYQFWLHTELTPRWGVLELIFNTPAHHRLHHAANPEYLNCNFGGVLIIFDRWFGTFKRESNRAKIIYGLTQPIDYLNPIDLAFHHWRGLIRDLSRATTWQERLKIAFLP
jgi:sterol desaturase/sphingolipid hydroxylase (fatty acid hydroxylase superfamily)